MAASDSRYVYKVLQILTHDVVLVGRVVGPDLGIGIPRKTRSAQLALAGVDTYWLASEKADPSFVDDEESRLPEGFVLPRAVVRPSVTASPEFMLPKYADSYDNGRREAVSLASPVRLAVGYSPREISHEDLVAHLREGTLSIPSSTDIAAIEVASGTWITSGFLRKSNGRLQFESGFSLRSADVVTISGRPDTLHLPSGLVVFRTPPNWSPPKKKDLRPQSEILAAAEAWIGRIRMAAEGSPGDGSVAEALRRRIETTADEDERSDISAAAALLSGRKPLLDLIPQIMASDPAWQTRLREFEQSERDRLRDEVRRRLDEEAEVERRRVEELKSQVTEAETRLATATHREALLRGESERHETRIREMIAEAARELGSSSRKETESLRLEIARLGEVLAELEKAPALDNQPMSAPVDDGEIEQIRPILLLDDDGTTALMHELSSSTGLTPAELAALLVHSVEGVPVLVGNGSERIAADIVTAFGGDSSALVFCDPTRVSLDDLMRDEASGLRSAVETARNHPEALVHVALCGITSGPCEYWLTAMTGLRRIGRLPRNLALIASAAVDGARVPVPTSLLRHLFPVELKSEALSAAPAYRGSIPMPTTRQGRIQEAMRTLAQSDPRPAPESLGPISHLLSLSPAGDGLPLRDVADVLLRQEKWLADIRDDSQSELIRHFTNFGG